MTYTNVLALVLGLLVTVVSAVFLRFTKLGTAMRAMANDREITASLGVPVRRVTAAAWFGCGVPGRASRACCSPTWSRWMRRT